MPLLLTGVLPFLGHDHASAVAFLTCRHHNFHGSIIPEFLSNEERVQKFCEARQKNQLKVDFGKQYTNLNSLFVQTPLMQFSPSLVLHGKDCNETILKPLLSTKYFTRTLQRCFFCPKVEITADLLQGLSQVQSLTELDLGESEVQNEHLEIISNSFPSLETLTLQKAGLLTIVDPSQPAISISSPPPPATTRTLQSLTMRKVEPLFAMQFISSHFTNLRKLELGGQGSSQELDLQPLSSSLAVLTDLSLAYFHLDNTESLKNLVHVSSLHFKWCEMPDSLSFLTQEENSTLPELTTLCIDSCYGSAPDCFSFSSLAHAPNLHVLEVNSDHFIDDSLQYLENMVHLRKLDLSYSNINGDEALLEMVIHRSFQLEELNAMNCNIGNKGAIAGALYSTHSRLRVLNLRRCSVVDDDLNGIGALKNTLEVLNLSMNNNLTNEGLLHCKYLAKLKKLNLECSAIDDFSPLKDCLNLEELDVSDCCSLIDDSFRVFSEEPNSFPNLRVLDLSESEGLTENVFKHLSKNNHFVYQLKTLNVERMPELLSSSATARNSMCQLKGLQRLVGGPEWTKHADELMTRLRNLEEIE